MVDNQKEFLESCFRDIDMEISRKQLEQFMEYYELLVEWNSFMNLTSITEFEEVCVKHFVDSVSLVKAVDLSKELSMIDIGTGAGFPGIPLKIMFPDLKITLLDSLQKRIHFLDTVIDKLKLQDICTIHGRAEDYAHDGLYREKFDLAVSRAVANLSTLSEYCLPFVKLNGFFISYKSEKIDEEAANAKSAIFLLGGKFEASTEFTIGDSRNYRNLFMIRKVNGTPKKYPRKAGLPSKKPL